MFLTIPRLLNITPRRRRSFRATTVVVIVNDPAVGFDANDVRACPPDRRCSSLAFLRRFRRTCRRRVQNGNVREVHPFCVRERLKRLIRYNVEDTVFPLGVSGGAPNRQFTRPSRESVRKKRPRYRTIFTYRLYRLYIRLREYDRRNILVGRKRSLRGRYAGNECFIDVPEFVSSRSLVRNNRTNTVYAVPVA